MSIGFIHGVMNTDNIAISGETIDYGPCAFMDKYNPKTVFSSIDHSGRYSYQNQPAILIWNLAKFAETLIPLIDEDSEISIKKLTEILHHTMPLYQEYFYKEFAEKLGLQTIDNKNIKIIDNYLKILHSESIDFTLSTYFNPLSLARVSISRISAAFLMPCCAAFEYHELASSKFTEVPIPFRKKTPRLYCALA